MNNSLTIDQLFLYYKSQNPISLNEPLFVTSENVMQILNTDINTASKIAFEYNSDVVLSELKTKNPIKSADQTWLIPDHAEQLIMGHPEFLGDENSVSAMASYATKKYNAEIITLNMLKRFHIHDYNSTKITTDTVMRTYNINEELAYIVAEKYNARISLKQFERDNETLMVNGNTQLVNYNDIKNTPHIFSSLNNHFITSYNLSAIAAEEASYELISNTLLEQIENYSPIQPEDLKRSTYTAICEKTGVDYNNDNLIIHECISRTAKKYNKKIINLNNSDERSVL